MVACGRSFYLRARYYDPATAQFTSRDPALATTGEPHSYSYDNPLNMSDPTGLFSWDDIRQAGGAIAGGIATGIGFAHDNIAVPFAKAVLGYAAQAAGECASQTVGGIASCSFTVVTTLGMLIPGEGEGEAAAEGAVRIAPDLENLSAKIIRQMGSRGWTREQIGEACSQGDRFAAENLRTGGAASRCVHPVSGQSVVVDDTTYRRGHSRRRPGVPVLTSDELLARLGATARMIPWRVGEELAWPREVIDEVIDQLAALGLAILGLEAWDRSTTASGPLVKGVTGYRVDGVGAWRQIVERSRQQAHHALGSLAASSYVNVTWASAEDMG